MDDFLVFFQADSESYKNLKDILDSFARFLGLNINARKSIIVFNPNTLRQFKKFLGGGLGITVK